MSKILYFIAVKDGKPYKFSSHSEFEARTEAMSRLGSCNDFYQTTPDENEIHDYPLIQNIKHNALAGAK